LAPTCFAGAVSICDTVAGNLVQNCGFEADGSAVTYPSNWTTDAGYALEAGVFNRVTPNYNSGGYALQFGNYDDQGPAGISQTLADSLGEVYSVSFYTYDGGANGDSNASFSALVDGTSEFTLTGCNGCPTAANGAYTQYQFDFTGSGSDTLGFQAQTNPSEWYLDDIVVLDTGSNVGTPEPASWLLMICGLAAMGIIGHRSLAREPGSAA
jgi:hypothetical protein